MKRYNNYCGNKNVDYVYYNEWADPEIYYKGFKWSAWEVEEALKEPFEEEHPGGTAAQFAAYINTRVEDLLDDWIYALGYFDIHYIKKNIPGFFETLRSELYYSDEWDSWKTPQDDEVIDRYSGINFVVNDYIS